MRRTTSMEWEAAKAALSTAGFRVLLQASHSATNGANTVYTVQHAMTRRVVCCALGTSGDIRVNYNAAATNVHMPILAANHFVIDAKKDDTIQFWNTTGSPILVAIMEVE